MSEPAASGPDPEISRLVLDLMPQARSEAWKVFSGAPHALDLDDLTSLAYAGLVMAAARWPAYCAERDFHPGCGQVPCADPANCGTRYFAAYALRRIKGAMLDAMRSADHVTRSMRSRAKAIAEADAGHGRPEAEIAARTGLSPAQIRQALAQVSARPVSFDAESHDVAGPGDTESQAAVSGILAAVSARLGALDAPVQVVLALRFHQGLELGQIAERLGVPEALVAQWHDAGVLAVHDAMLRAAR